MQRTRRVLLKTLRPRMMLHLIACIAGRSPTAKATFRNTMGSEELLESLNNVTSMNALEMPFVARPLQLLTMLIFPVYDKVVLSNLDEKNVKLKGWRYLPMLHLKALLCMVWSHLETIPSRWELFAHCLLPCRPISNIHSSVRNLQKELSFGKLKK